MSISYEVVTNVQSKLGECPTWDDQTQRLFWVDGLGQEVHVFDPASGKDVFFPVPQPVGSLALTDRAGVVLLALQDGLYILNTNNGTLTPYLTVEADMPGNRFNDGKCDSLGRFWFGSMNTAANEGGGGCAATGSVYCMEKRKLKKIFSGVTISNGLGWDLDNRRFYYIDSPCRVIFGFDYDAVTGALANRRVVVDLTRYDKELPDGMAVDAEGMLWVAMWGGYRVCRFDPRDGTCLAELKFPVRNITSCAFGGKSLDELYVTTSRIDAEGAEKELAGALFRVKPGVRGLKSHRYID